MEFDSVSYGHSRSGSTAIYQIANKIFCNTKKTHGFIKTDKPVIVCYRDFRAATVSYWRVTYGQKQLTLRIRLGAKRSSLHSVVGGCHQPGLKTEQRRLKNEAD
jgi:hypothetical protein